MFVFYFKRKFTHTERRNIFILLNNEESQPEKCYTFVSNIMTSNNFANKSKKKNEIYRKIYKIKWQKGYVGVIDKENGYNERLLKKIKFIIFYVLHLKA